MSSATAFERAFRGRAVVLLALTVLTLTTTAACGGEPATIDRLVVLNSTPYDLEVSVTDSERDGWVLLGRARAGERSVDQRIQDLGAVWIFRFEYGGDVVGDELRLSREALEEEEWTVTVPHEVEEFLRDRDVEPSARR